MWISGSGNQVEFEDIIEDVKKHTLKNGSVFIGCDSQIVRDKCTFSTVICLHGSDDQRGGYYFFKREKLERKTFPTLLLRLTKEVEKSIEMASIVSEISDNIDIEIHVDASPSSKKDNKTSKFSDMLMGYVKGSGFRCKIKPDAWASNSVADKHSK